MVLHDKIFKLLLSEICIRNFFFETLNVYGNIREHSFKEQFSTFLNSCQQNNILRLEQGTSTPVTIHVSVSIQFYNVLCFFVWCPHLLLRTLTRLTVKRDRTERTRVCVCGGETQHSLQGKQNFYDSEGFQALTGRSCKGRRLQI